MLRNSRNPALLLVALAALMARGGAQGQALTFVEAHFDGVAGVDGLGGSMSVAVSPDGRHVYVGGNFDSALAVFARNEATGALTFVEAVFDGAPGNDGLFGVRSVAVSPDGRHVLTVALNEDKIGIFSRAAATGELTFLAVRSEPPLDGLEGPFAVDLSPDGTSVYVAAIVDDSVAAFSRDAISGELTFVEAEFDGLGGVDGLDSARAVAVSSGGENVYVASAIDDAVALFDRDQATGELSFVEAVFDGVGGVEGLDSAADLVVVPDGRHVVVGTHPDFEGDGWIVVFARDEITGSLTFVESHTNPGPPGLPGCPIGPSDPDASVVASPAGELLYATNAPVNALAVFRRDPPSGTLQLIEAHCQGVAGVEGMETPAAVAVSPDGRSVYVGSMFGSSLAVFQTTALIFADGFESGDTSAWSATAP